MVSATKQYFFVGSYASAHYPGIFSLAFDTESGELTDMQSFKGVECPSFLVVHPNGRWLYAVSETGNGDLNLSGSVWAFDINQDSMDIRPINRQSTQGDWPCHAVLDRTGRWLATTNYGTGNAAIFPILSDGRLGRLTALVQHAGAGPVSSRQEGPHAHSAVFTPDNLYLIVADLGIDQLIIYRFDTDAGTLTNHAQVQSNPGAGPRHFAFHPNGHILFVANELDNSVTVYRYDAVGALTPLQSLNTLPVNDPTSSVADIHISNAGDRLYVSNRGHNSIAVFNVEEDGNLTPLGHPSCGGNWPRNFVLDPSGKFMLVANLRTNSVSVLPVNSNNAELGTTISQVTVLEPACIAFQLQKTIDGSQIESSATAL